MYENSIIAIPKGVLKKFRWISSQFLWAGHNFPQGTHLASWKTIAAPKEMGGWGLKKILPFARSLAGRNVWRLTQGSSLWTRVMNSKYFPNQSIVEWFQNIVKSPKGLIVWKSLVEAFPLVGN
jgi:hypothetical protein